MQWVVVLLTTVVGLGGARTVFDYERDGLENEQYGNPGSSVVGQYEWRAPSGKVVEVSYVADHMGFRLTEDIGDPLEPTLRSSRKVKLEEKEEEEEETEETEESGSGEEDSEIEGRDANEGGEEEEEEEEEGGGEEEEEENEGAEENEAEEENPQEPKTKSEDEEINAESENTKSAAEGGPEEESEATDNPEGDESKGDAAENLGTEKAASEENSSTKEQEEAPEEATGAGKEQSEVEESGMGDVAGKSLSSNLEEKDSVKDTPVLVPTKVASAFPSAEPLVAVPVQSKIDSSPENKEETDQTDTVTIAEFQTAQASVAEATVAAAETFPVASHLVASLTGTSPSPMDPLLSKISLTLVPPFQSSEEDATAVPNYVQEEFTNPPLQDVGIFQDSSLSLGFSPEINHPGDMTLVDGPSQDFPQIFVDAQPLTVPDSSIITAPEEGLIQSADTMQLFSDELDAINAQTLGEVESELPTPYFEPLIADSPSQIEVFKPQPDQTIGVLSEVIPVLADINIDTANPQAKSLSSGVQEVQAVDVTLLPDPLGDFNSPDYPVPVFEALSIDSDISGIAVESLPEPLPLVAPNPVNENVLLSAHAIGNIEEPILAGVVEARDVTLTADSSSPIAAFEIAVPQPPQTSAPVPVTYIEVPSDISQAVMDDVPQQVQFIEIPKDESDSQAFPIPVSTFEIPETGIPSPSLEVIPEPLALTAESPQEVAVAQDQLILFKQEKQNTKPAESPEIDVDIDLEIDYSHPVEISEKIEPQVSQVAFSVNDAPQLESAIHISKNLKSTKPLRQLDVREIPTYLTTPDINRQIPVTQYPQEDSPVLIQTPVDDIVPEAVLVDPNTFLVPKISQITTAPELNQVESFPHRFELPLSNRPVDAIPSSLTQIDTDNLSMHVFTSKSIQGVEKAPFVGNFPSFEPKTEITVLPAEDYPKGAVLLEVDLEPQAVVSIPEIETSLPEADVLLVSAAVPHETLDIEVSRSSLPRDLPPVLESVIPAAERRHKLGELPLLPPLMKIPKLLS